PGMLPEGFRLCELRFAFTAFAQSVRRIISLRAQGSCQTLLRNPVLLPLLWRGDLVLRKGFKFYLARLRGGLLIGVGVVFGESAFNHVVGFLSRSFAWTPC